MRNDRTLETVRISNQATYMPVALSDVVLAAPLLSRVLLGATAPGRLLQAAALGMYVGSATIDWIQRRGARSIDFLSTFGADLKHLRSMPERERRLEVRRLAEQVSDIYTPVRIPRYELAELVDERLTDYIATMTGQRVETSAEVRDFTLTKLIFPFALGACDILSGDVAIFQNAGVFEPHVIAHEFCHRKGYYKELEAQALAYLALVASDEVVLVQSALCERLHRQMRVLAGDDIGRFHELVGASGLRAELQAEFRGLRPIPSAFEESVGRVIRPIYEMRMRLTGQNGLSDYDMGFTDFLYTLEVGQPRRRVPIG